MRLFLDLVLKALMKHDLEKFPSIDTIRTKVAISPFSCHLQASFEAHRWDIPKLTEITACSGQILSETRDQVWITQFQAWEVGCRSKQHVAQQMAKVWSLTIRPNEYLCVESLFLPLSLQFRLLFWLFHSDDEILGLRIEWFDLYWLNFL